MDATGDTELELYDEFGNYIGPPLESDDEASYAVENDNDVDNDFFSVNSDTLDAVGDDLGVQAAPQSRAVVLHEDKDYFPSAEQVYGPGVEILVQEEDTQLLTQPIVEPRKPNAAHAAGAPRTAHARLPKTTYDKGYLLDVIDRPELNRIVAVVGSLHHGKTSLVDLLVSETHVPKHEMHEKPSSSSFAAQRYTDVHPLERKRGMSIKTTPITLLHADSHGKSHAVHWIDTPGHADFNDEVTAAIALADGAIVIVDCVEGVTMSLARELRQLARNAIPFVLFVNKIDRLINELRIPPSDAYFKIKAVIEEVNSVIRDVIFKDPTTTNQVPPQRVSPELGNVIFGSTKYRYMFTLGSFAQKYVELNDLQMDIHGFSPRLWGEHYYDQEKNVFTKRRSNNTSDRTFVRFIMEPIYKITSHILGERWQDLMKLVPKLGVSLKKTEYKQDTTVILRTVMNKFLGSSVCLVDTVLKYLPSPVLNGERKSKCLYKGQESKATYAMMHCDREGPLMAFVTKLYSNDDCTRFDAFARVLSGTLRTGQTVKILGESYHPIDNDDDISETTISSLHLYEARYHIPVDYAVAGSLVLIRGIDSTIVKTCTIVDTKSFNEAENDEENTIFAFDRLKLDCPAVMKLAIDPLKPSELPKMLEAIRKALKSYPALETRVEESGEHTIFGVGEFYLDCVMHDLRSLFSGIEIKVSMPMVALSETIEGSSRLPSMSQSANGHNKITVVADAMEESLIKDIESGSVDISWSESRELSRSWSTKYGWDLLRVRNIWAFGPTVRSTNVLVNDTLEDVSQDLSSPKQYAVKESLKQGFRWASREGPLAEEPMRGVSFRIMDVSLSSQAVYRSSGQLIPTMRRASYGAFLAAQPRLMEPVMEMEVIAPQTCVSLVRSALSKRRGRIVQTSPRAGTPLYSMLCEVPLVDSFGLETDIRMHSQGQAFVQCAFQNWGIVPGQPLDTTLEIPTLQPAEDHALARDLLLKTRRRKGLSDDIAWGTLLDPSMVAALHANNV